MKKAIVFAAFLGIVALCSSCKKECTCETTTSGITVTTKVKLEDNTYKTCRDLGDEMNKTAASDDVSVVCH